jgi:anti-anti-sigma factor
MERHHMTMAASVHARTDKDTDGSVATHVRAAFNDTIAQTDRAAGRAAGFVAPDIGLRMHTLVLTGALDRSSVHRLEAEIERLCEDGVTGITLDLRQLADIDAFGVAVIAFRCGLCRRRGYDFALIRGSRTVQRAFEKAGVSELLPFADESAPVQSPPALTLEPHLKAVAGGER